MAKVVVLGAGVMGSTITIPLTDNHHTVSLIGTHLDTDMVVLDR
jgi:glycerol-3-phosphate dehydrogenase (NAD(P)+)